MPTIVVVVLAVLGLSTFPQGGEKLSDARPKAANDRGGSHRPVEDGKDEEDLGPLATLRAADRLDLLEPSPQLANPENPRRFPVTSRESVRRDLAGRAWTAVSDPACAQPRSDEHEPRVRSHTERRGSVPPKAPGSWPAWSRMPGFTPTKKSVEKRFQSGPSPKARNPRRARAGLLEREEVVVTRPQVAGRGSFPFPPVTAIATRR